MELVVFNQSGKETSKKVSLSSEIFGIAPNDHAIYLDVKSYLANQRQGTHKSKERAEVAGSTKKIKKQKGTGGARAGSLKSPVFVGGGRIFGPRPRNYSFKLNKKVKLLARQSALAYKALDNNITVIEDLNFVQPKTKSYLELLKSFSLVGKKTLLVVDSYSDNVYLSSRNIPKTKVVVASDINTYDLLNAEILLLSESAVSKVEQLFN